MLASGDGYIDIVTALLANVSSSDVDTINNVGNHLTASGQ